MSCIYWHTEHEGEVKVSGRERAHMGCMTADLATTFLPRHARRDHAGMDRVDQSFFKPFEYRGDTTYYLDEERLATALRSGFDGEGVLFDEDGKRLESFSLLLNTVIRIGNDAVCLMARLHAQCELHAYVEGPNRGWLADLIEQGREQGVMRRDMGWEPLCELLRARDDAPVVTSYSVCDRFPPSFIEYDEDDNELNEQPPSADRWRRGMAELRAEPDQGLELRREWLRLPFGHGRHLLGFFDPAPAPV